MDSQRVRVLAQELDVAAGYARMVLPDGSSSTDDATMANARNALVAGVSAAIELARAADCPVPEWSPE